MTSSARSSRGHPGRRRPAVRRGPPVVRPAGPAGRPRPGPRGRPGGRLGGGGPRRRAVGGGGADGSPGRRAARRVSGVGRHLRLARADLPPHSGRQQPDHRGPRDCPASTTSSRRPSTTRSTSCSRPSRPGPAGPSSSSRRVDRDLRALERGVQMRTLYQHTARRSQATRDHVERILERGAKVRTLDEFFNRLIVIDRRLAVIPGGSPDIALAIHDSNLVSYLADVFDRSWERAREYDERGRRLRERHRLRGAAADRAHAHRGSQRPCERQARRASAPAPTPPTSPPSRRSTAWRRGSSWLRDGEQRPGVSPREADRLREAAPSRGHAPT